MHSVEKNLSHIGRLNHHLADELAKLPEIRKYKTNASQLALDNLLKIYRFAPCRFDHMFEGMNAIGLPAHRHYCSPLQALFWMIQDEKLEASGVLLGIKIAKTTDADGRCRPRHFSEPEPSLDENNATGPVPEFILKKVLDDAWNGEPSLMTGSNIHDIIDGIRAGPEAEEYAILVKHHSDKQLQGYIMDDFLKKKEAFDVNDWNAIEKAVSQSRWKRFYTVADRLNSPELISYYINKYFFFRKIPASGVYFTFFQKTAQCTDAAYFAQFMLKRAGYRIFMRSVKWDEDPWNGLHTGAGIILDDGRYLLVSNYTGTNSISGPFPDIESLDRKLSCNKKITDSRWGAYYPPRHY